MEQTNTLANILEAILLAAEIPLSVEDMQGFFDDDEKPTTAEVEAAIIALEQKSQDNVWRVKKVASGYRLQVKYEYAKWVGKLYEEKPVKYSRAMLETLALIAYRQPITRGEIEDVRGVSVSSHIIRTLQERNWIRVVGHRDVPGRPAMFGTTKNFLDYFNLETLDQLPSLMPLRDISEIEAEMTMANIDEEALAEAHGGEHSIAAGIEPVPSPLNQTSST